MALRATTNPAPAARLGRRSDDPATRHEGLVRHQPFAIQGDVFRPRPSPCVVSSLRPSVCGGRRTRKLAYARHEKHEKLGRQFAHCSTTALGYAPKLTSRPSLLPVHLFPKPIPKFTIDFIDCTAHGVAFFWIYQLSVHAKNYSKSSCSIVSLVSKISCSLRSRRFVVARSAKHDGLEIFCQKVQADRPVSV